MVISIHMSYFILWIRKYATIIRLNDFFNIHVFSYSLIIKKYAVCSFYNSLLLMSNIRFSIHTYYPYFVQKNYSSSFGHMFTGVSLIPHVTEKYVVGNHGCKNGVFKRHGGVITGVIYDHDTLTRKVADCVPENCYHPDQQPIISMEIQHTPYHLDLYPCMWCIGLELHHAQFHNYSTSSTHAYGAISCDEYYVQCGSGSNTTPPHSNVP